MDRFILVLCLLVSGCASTPQGKSIDRSNTADLSSTVVGLLSGASEANPLMPYVVPLKLSMGYYIDKAPCEDRIRYASAVNPIFYGATGNNLMAAAGFGVATALPFGIAVGVSYAIWKEKLEPKGTFSCEE